jgi:predicted amidohydrolase YtcJ
LITRFSRASVWTAGRPARAQAFLVRDGRFEAIGSEEAVARAAPPGARVIDLGGDTIVPGFRDAHVHLSAGSLAASWLDLAGCASAHEVARRVAAAAAGTAAGRWIRGWGWDQSRWSPPAWPERAILDALVPEHPVLLTRADGHVAWLNGAALARLGWNERTADPGGGRIGRDPATGAPSGVVFERAAEIAAASVPEPGEDERRAAVALGLAEARRLGVTAVDDIAEPWALELYARARERSAPSCRVHAWLPFALERKEAEELRRRHPPGDPWLSTGTLKIFLDGTLGARTAALHAPYSDAPDTRGELRHDPSDLAPRMRAAAEAGWTLALHAIGDRAVTTALDLLEALPAGQDGPHRIEHVQVVCAEDVRRFSTAGVLASVQPVHYRDDRHWIVERLGRERAARAYPILALTEAGAAVVFGSDYPIASLDPLRNLRAATDPERPGRVPFEVALAAAVRTPIAPGAPADFVRLSSGDLESAQVVETYVDGRRVHPV